MVKNREMGGEVGIMKIKKIYIILIVISILILIFAFNQKSKEHREGTNRNIIEKSLNKEKEVILETQKETLEREETKEERVKKMYELMPPSETIVE